jgi:dipeptidyl aminopeptidase/acylaminoacyl peptidase
VSFADLDDFVALPRTTGLAVSPDGARLVATVQEAAADRYTSAIWDLTGPQPQRLTRSEKGETDPAFLPDGSLLFVSSRAAPDVAEDESALWCLPPSGEASVLAYTSGGVSGPVVATSSATVVVAGRRLLSGESSGGTGAAEEDARLRRERKDRKITAILHTGMPIRFWDEELGEESRRLFVMDGGQLRDLTPDAGLALTNPSYSISADGRTLATSWRRRKRGGEFPYDVVLIDVPTGARTMLADSDDGWEHQLPRIAPDGRRVAVLSERTGSFDTPFAYALRILGSDGASAVTAQLGELYPTEWAWSPDSALLYVAGDRHGRAPVLAVDPDSGAVLREIAADAAYFSLCAAADGGVYGLRSTPAEPPAPVRLEPRFERLPDPAPVPELPGTLHDVSVPVGGATVRGWLCLPSKAARAAAGAPLLTFIHGGPFMSTNAWSWRWNPWPAVARGWAVLLPDPTLSTGYGPDWIARAWPHRAGLVWRDIEALLDHVLATQPVDPGRTACLGGSFGGYMTNWIAGHTDRFAAIVTHAGLWALDQQHATTDAAFWKTSLFGRPEEHPDWYAEHSPHNFADKIVTPMLVVHGNRDYRVPVSEALRLWWDLVSRWDGAPEDLPHRFLQFTGENHWILRPADARIWYETVLGFCAEHGLG